MHDVSKLAGRMADDPTQPFPIRLQRHRSRGRELLASEAIAAGGVVIRNLPLALAPADSQLSSCCAACLSSVGGASAKPCSGRCGYVLCASCAADGRWAATHELGECVSLRQLWTLLGRDGPSPPTGKRPRLDSAAPPVGGDSAALRVLLRLAYTRVAERRPGSQAVDECPHGEALSDDCSAADELVSHFDELSEAQQGHAYNMAETARWCLTGDARQSREALAHRAAMLWCNSFDVVDAETGVSLGEGLWPSLALGLNHSCEPNCDFHWEPDNAGAMCVRALRDIAAGEVLSIAYLNLFSAKRREHLRSTYFFTCRCRRCTTRDAAPHVPPLAKAAAEAIALAKDPATWARVAEAAVALEAAVAPLVAAGADWARLTLARARWLRLRAAEHGATGPAPLLSVDALRAELTRLLGERHPWTRRVDAAFCARTCNKRAS